ncbi:hypothetical protein FJTKL_02721 [Diaporthe vaccinii]|uniref:Fungal STAND N-terminal Goodbye domain-containing protein n=1 Tax=Diaporthe vaccinii TaxID=105482 RepID=A0ABR4DX12_9PEZI
MSFAKRREDRNSFIIAWTELTKMVRSISDVTFPSQAITNQLLRSGRYISIIEHFRLLLSGWEGKHLKNFDYNFIQAVVDGCLETLRITAALAQRNILRYAPVGVFLRITTASVFLLKALAVGVSATRLRRSLDTLTRAISALRASAPDDLHLCGRCATLLETSLNRLHGSFVPSSRPPSFATRPPSAEREGTTASGAEADPNSGVDFQGDLAGSRCLWTRPWCRLAWMLRMGFSGSVMIRWILYSHFRAAKVDC